MSERLSPERAVRLLRAKAAELEVLAQSNLSDFHSRDVVTEEHVGHLTADIALIAGLLADHIERDSHHPFAGPTWSPDIDDANVREMRDG